MTTRELKHQARLEKWKEQIAECRSSGKSVRNWCEDYGINPKTYYYWERMCLEKITRKPQSQSEALMRIEPSQLPTEKTGAGDSTVHNAGITVRLKDIEIEFPSGTSMTTISELLRLVITPC